MFLIFNYPSPVCSELQITSLAHKQDMKDEVNSIESEKNIVMLLLPRLTGSLDVHKMVTL